MRPSLFLQMAAPPPHALPPSLRKTRLLLILALVLVCLTCLLLLLRDPWRPDEDARRASTLMRQGMAAVGELREELGIPVDTALDPARTGLIGTDYSDLTTSVGSLSAKQTSLNPDFAGLVTFWLKQAGVHRGDTVAVCLTGSFPALNLAALCACETLGLNPVIFSSVGASNYGANIPGFTWLDMERGLKKRGLLHVQTRFASLGGIMDNEGGLDGTGYALGEEAIRRHGATSVPENGVKGLEADMKRRMDLYFQKGRPKAFINVGGGVTSLGWVSEAALLDNGLLARVPSTQSPLRGIIFRMYEKGIPVIHLINIERLAARYGLPEAPSSVPDGKDREERRLLRIAGTLLLFAAWWLLSACALVSLSEKGTSRRQQQRPQKRT